MARGALSDRCSFVKVLGHVAAGTTVQFGASLDMHDNGGYEGVEFITSYGTANALNYVYAQVSDDNSTFSDFTSGTIAGNRAGNGNYVRLDIRHPSKRYVRPYAGRGSSTTLESIWAVRYGPRHLPAANSNAVVGDGGTDTNTTLEGPS